MQHPRIVEALDRLWAAANTDDADQVLDRAEYQVMHRKLVLALDPTTPPSEAVETAEEDWGRDSEGEEGLDKERPNPNPNPNPNPHHSPFTLTLTLTLTRSASAGAGSNSLTCGPRRWRPPSS